jgi:hypothetical protein
MTWLEDHQGELALLHRLRQKAASGGASDEEMCRLRALQMELGIRAVDAFDGRGVALTKLEHELDELDAVRKRVETFLGHEE